METGKTTRYFKYAIGEIILVVFGILIAVQINDWNEQRKTLSKTKIYVNKIINDLISDTLNINELIARSDLSEKNINNYFEIFKTSDSLGLSLDQIIDSANHVSFYFMKYYPVNKTFKDMEVSNNGNLLSESQRDILIDLVSQQEEFDIIIQSQIDIAIEHQQNKNQFLGLDHDFYSQLNQTNSLERKTQGLLHTHIMLDASKDLYRYIEKRGVRIKEMSNKTIVELQKTTSD